MNKIDSLKNDITLLETCVNGLSAEITALDSLKTRDHKLISNKIKDKDDTEKLLEVKKIELESEEYKEKNKPKPIVIESDEKLFNRKDNSYTVSRNSYIKPVDN